MEVRIKKGPSATWRVYLNDCFIECDSRQAAVELYEKAVIGSLAPRGGSPHPLTAGPAFKPRRERTS